MAHRTAAVGYNQVAARKRTVVAGPDLMADRSWAVTYEHTAAADNRAVARRTRAGHNRVAPDKRTALLCKLVADCPQAKGHGEGVSRKRMADCKQGVAYGRVAPHNRSALAQNRAAGTGPGPLHDRAMRPRRLALPR